MKILQLRFANLNSLTGEWQIDFTDPAFAVDGIFAITGPTGAGKSTILDAICLALYGRTPRLARISMNSNEIMSRQTGECFAEVTFATAHGRFRCHWSQHRSRRKPDGQLQQPKQEIARADTGEILATRLRDVDERVVRVTGMDFERFTRSVLLAQGGFAAFLQATADERAPILEQITGTDIYSRISIRTHEMQREQREQLKLLEARLSGIRLLSAEEERELADGLRSKDAAARQLAERLQVQQQALQIRQTVLQLQQEREALQQEQQQLVVRREEFAPQRSRLALALQAAELEPQWVALTTLRARQEQDRQRLQQEQQGLPELAVQLENSRVQQSEAQQQLQQARADWQQAQPLLRQVRELDQQLHNQQQALQERQAEAEREQGRVTAIEKDQLQLQQRVQAEQQRLHEVTDWLREHVQDQWLVGGLAGIEQQLQQLQAQQERQAGLQQNREQATAVLQQTAADLQQQHIQQEQALQQLQEAQTLLEQHQSCLQQLLAGRELREYKSEHKHLGEKRILLTQIQTLEEQRDRLQSGSPCPLCGATEHPYNEGKLPQADELDQQIDALEQRVAQIEAQQEVCRQQEQQVAQQQAACAAMESAVLAAEGGVEMQRQTLSSLERQWEEQQELLAGLHAEVVQSLQPLGIQLDQAAPIAPLLQSLRQRQVDWLQQQERRQQLENSLGSLQGDAKNLQSMLGLHQGQLQQQQERLRQQQAACRGLQQQREQLYGLLQPDAEEERLQLAQRKAEEQAEQQRQQLQQMERQHELAAERIRQLQQNLQQQQDELTQQQNSLQQTLCEKGFVDEAALQAALLPAAERQDLQQQAQQLDEAGTRLQARLEDNQRKLAEQQTMDASTEPLEQLQIVYQQTADELQEVRDQLATLREQQRLNEQARKSQTVQLQALQRQQQECLRWDDLHELIGSADGKKFRNFAQGLTFELVVSHANRTLQQMSDRYLLVRDPDAPLELNVVDSYQAGEMRSTKNLSGGESFIVSLALALGLSRMASQNVRVDSLFLDEGFGTLDEEALDVALDTLSGLQQDGKLIGVISHVQALKERIATQIAVRPFSGGRSRLEGPGCRQIS